MNGVSVRIDQTTTNAFTGHLLNAGSILFDQFIAICTGSALSFKHKQKFVMSMSIITWGCIGIVIGQWVANAIRDGFEHGDFKPRFTTLGVVYFVLLAAHDCLLLENWCSIRMVHSKMLTQLTCRKRKSKKAAAAAVHCEDGGEYVIVSEAGSGFFNDNEELRASEMEEHDDHAGLTEAMMD